MNKDLLLEGVQERFDRDYAESMKILKTQNINLQMQAKLQNSELHKALAKELGSTYTEINKQVPSLKQLYITNKHLSQKLQNIELEISAIIEEMTNYSERIRVENSLFVVYWQIADEGLLVLLFISGWVVIRALYSQTNYFINKGNGAV